MGCFFCAHVPHKPTQPAQPPTLSTFAPHFDNDRSVAACKIGMPANKMRYFDYYRNPDKLIDPKTGTEVIFLKDDDLELHFCKRAKPRHGGNGKLFCSRNKRWFHLHADGKLTEIKHLFSPAMRTPGRQCYNGKRGCSYPTMRDFSMINCHILIFEAWEGERDLTKEIDHKNGNVLDYALENLEQVTRSENSWRSVHVLQVLRAKGFDLLACSGTDMDKWFAIFRALEMAGRVPRELSAEELKALFDKYELVDPQARMEYEMTHHCEC